MIIFFLFSVMRRDSFPWFHAEKRDSYQRDVIDKNAECCSNEQPANRQSKLLINTGREEFTCGKKGLSEVNIFPLLSKILISIVIRTVEFFFSSHSLFVVVTFISKTVKGDENDTTNPSRVWAHLSHVAAWSLMDVSHTCKPHEKQSNSLQCLRQDVC